MTKFEWLHPLSIGGTLLYALMGIIIFWAAFIIIDKITPYDLWREIVEKQNKALGMVVAAMCLGISTMPYSRNRNAPGAYALARNSVAGSAPPISATSSSMRRKCAGSCRSK